MKKKQKHRLRDIAEEIIQLEKKGAKSEEEMNKIIDKLISKYGEENFMEIMFEIDEIIQTKLIKTK